MACLRANPLLMIEEVRTKEFAPVISGDRRMSAGGRLKYRDCPPSANSF
jgi:hypothetical protein